MVKLSVSANQIVASDGVEEDLKGTGHSHCPEMGMTVIICLPVLNMRSND